MREFRRRLDGELRGVAWSEEMSAAVFAKTGVVRGRKTLLVLVAALLLCAATGFAAVRVGRSREASALSAARAEISARYGLSAETIAFFNEQYEDTASGWRVRYSSVFPEKTGFYEVRSERGELLSEWSLEGGNAGGEIWREEELRAYLSQFAFLRGEAVPNDFTFVLGESANSVFMSDIVYARPEKGELSSEEAIRAATDALREDMGADAEPEGYVYTEFVESVSGKRMWCVNMNVMRNGIGVCACAYVNAANGEIVSIDYESGGCG